jgi:uncharacterized membrane protein
MVKLNKSTRRVFVILGGFPLIIVGILLLVLPGPGIPVIILGLFILSLEFEWASRYLQKAKDTQRKALEKARRKKNTPKSKESETK